MGLGNNAPAPVADPFSEFRGRASKNYNEHMTITKANQYNNWYNTS